MKNLKRILAFILSIFIICVSVSQYTLVVCASDHGGAGGSDRETTSQKRWQDVKSGSKTAWEAMNEDGLVNHIMFVVSNLGAIVTLDFAKLIENSNVFDENFINKNVTVDDDGNIVYSKELIDYIKQALREYAEETCGFIIVPSVHIDSVSPSLFGNGYAYNTMKNFAKEYGMISVSKGSNYIMIYDMSGFVKNDAGFYLIADKSEFENKSYYRLDGMNFNTWTAYRGSKYLFLRTDELNKDLTSWEDAAEFCASASLSRITNSGSSYNFEFIKPTYNITSISGSYPYIITKDGRNVLIFNSKTALQNYSVDHRSIYFGSKFYEDTGEITAAFEDLQNYLDGKYDDFLEKLKDMIGDGNLSEDDLEKLVDKLLDQLKDVEGSIGDVDDSLKETNNLLEQILQALQSLDNNVSSALSGLEFSFDTSGIESYLEAILEQLGLISYQLEDMTIEEAEEKTDSLLSSLISAFSEIIDVAKVKFPLSIPWDIYGILSALGGINDSSELYESVSAVYSSDDGIVLFSNKNDDDIMPLSVQNVTTNDILTVPAPRFELPLVIESWDIDERIIVDLSDFEVVSQISRSMFSCIFAVILMNLTFKVVDFGKVLFS